MLAAILSFLGFRVASFGSQACACGIHDEPESPKILNKKII